MLKQIKFFILSILIIGILITNITISSASDSSQNLTSDKVIDKEVKVGLYLLHLGKFDATAGSFTADFYLSLKCDNACPPLDFEFMNGRTASFDKIIDKPNEKFYRIQANLNGPINLKKFPFDNQRLEITLEDKKSSIEELRYIPNLKESGIDESIAFIGWNIRDYEVEVREHEYALYNETYSQYVFAIPISRIIISAVFKTFLPITFILLIMLSSFVLNPDKITTRLAMVGSALVASVMFHISVANQIPPIGYLTFIDKFMVLSYFVILLSFIFNVFLLELYERKKDELVAKLHRYTEFTMFIIIPILYLFLFIFFL